MFSLPEGVDLNSLLLFLKNIGLESSSILRNFENGSIPLYDLNQNTKLKENINDPVTAADLTINKLFIDRFKEFYPDSDWEIITEENSKNSFCLNTKSNWVWLIDPLDGTKDFIQKTGEYAIHVALLFKKKTILGMVVLPSIEEIWFGVKNLGTWKDGEKEPIFVKDLEKISKIDNLKVVTSKNHNNKKLESILGQLNHSNISKMGSIGYKICSLLRNESNIYLSISDKTAPKDWDIAAPQMLMNSANFNFTYVSGDEINYSKEEYQQKGCLVASTLSRNEHLRVCKKIYEIIKELNL